MEQVVAFALLLLVGTLISERAHRSVVSTAVLFLAAGMVLGRGALGILDVRPGDQVVSALAELALFGVLFTDGMKVGIRDLKAEWRLPTRALGLGLPLTLIITAALGHLIVGLPWLESLLVAAALSPTDPVLAAAIVGREQIPLRLRRLLNIESGVNDGLVLPIVLVLIAATGTGPAEPFVVAARVAGGVALGVGLPWAVSWLERRAVFGVTARYRPLSALAVAMLLYGTSHLLGANPFLAAFAAGITIASIDPGLRESFEAFGELLTELLKLAAILSFGALLSVTFFRSIGWGGYLFAVLVVVAVRPIALTLALVPVRLPRKEWATTVWFGPKGFASVLYGLLILHSPAADASAMFRLVGLAVALSIVTHSSTDVLVARWFSADSHAPPPSADGEAEPELSAGPRVGGGSAGGDLSEPDAPG